LDFRIFPIFFLLFPFPFLFSLSLLFLLTQELLHTQRKQQAAAPRIAGPRAPLGAAPPCPPPRALPHPPSSSTISHAPLLLPPLCSLSASSPWPPIELSSPVMAAFYGELQPRSFFFEMIKTDAHNVSLTISGLNFIRNQL
jgi:hypothetical protein